MHRPSPIGQDGPVTGLETLHVQVPSPLLGEDVHAIVLSPTSAATGRRRWFWLLHGRGSSAEETRPLLAALGRAMTEGHLAPQVVVVPDGPWSDRASWWVDSGFGGSGSGGPPAGRPVESALLTDVLPVLEHRFGPPTGPQDRLIGGISMGGAAALRYVLVHADLFGGAALLSPAVYARDVPHSSSARTSGAFGSDQDVFRAGRFAELMAYPELLTRRAIGRRVQRVAIVVGDREPVQDAGGRPVDLDLLAAGLHSALKRRPDISSSLRVLDGAHDHDLWAASVVDVVRAAMEAG